MKDIYFVKYSFVNETQPLLRVHNNCNLDIESGTTDYWDFLNELNKAQHLDDRRDVVIDFMIKVGEL